MRGPHHHGNHHHESEGRRIGIAFWLNAGFAVVELIGGLLTNSVAVLSDAVHDLGDSLAIGSGWVAARLARREPDIRYTYGYRRLSLLSAAVNSLVLIVGSAWIVGEAVPRLLAPEAPHAGGMFGLGLLGIAVNGAGALALRRGRSRNERILSWHLIEDTLGWLAVLIGAVVIHFTGWAIVDPLLSIAFTLLILINVTRHLRATLQLFLQRTPDPRLTEAVRHALEDIPDVASSHHLHLWSLDGERHVLTVHLLLARALSAAAQVDLKQALDARLRPFGLAHTTIELEQPAETCRDQSDGER